jgi:hypothetical protein
VFEITHKEVAPLLATSRSVTRRIDYDELSRFYPDPKEIQSLSATLEFRVPLSI